ncbi:MAG TPA: sugar ABC transporter ATP-binding protein [Streptosporangiaceae bacterium]|nr:sugar ABC transporter ATP-binding protein [Streptosporangiaceae bacterium]
MTSGARRLELRDIEKRFGGVHALRGARFSVALDTGVIHGLLGENGSGKSTLLGVLSGQLRPDAGSIAFDGQPVTFPSPVEALAHGIAMVAQETAVLPDLSVAENIMLGRRQSRTPFGISWGDVRRRATEVLGRLNLDYDPDRLVGKLRPDQQQMVEIARVLATDARILILDEPTSSLTDDQTGALFTVIRRLRSQGVATIFVSHRLDEVMGLVDELTILRDGVTVCSAPIAEFTPDRIIEEMVGKGLLEQRRGEEAAAAARDGDPDDGIAPWGAGPVLRVRGLTVPGRVHGVDLDVHPGEIVGLAGLVGAGRSELLEAIFGAAPRSAGTIEMLGEPLTGTDPRAAIAAGLGYLPPDRKTAGLILSMTVRQNLTMVSTLGRPRISTPRAGPENAVMHRAVTSMHLRAASPNAEAATLSGGNQQKVALGKWLARQPRCLLLDEPTRGVDAAAKEEIHRILRESTASGLAMLVSSSEYDELLGLCDRILVAFRGRLVASLSSAQADQATIARFAGGYS